MKKGISFFCTIPLLDKCIVWRLYDLSVTAFLMHLIKLMFCLLWGHYCTNTFSLFSGSKSFSLRRWITNPNHAVWTSNSGLWKVTFKKNNDYKNMLYFVPLLYRTNLCNTVEDVAYFCITCVPPYLSFDFEHRPTNTICNELFLTNHDT